MSAGFWAIHLAAVVGVAVLGWSWRGLALAALLYLPRMFFITAGYHRYFSHRAYRTSRWFQLVLAVGATATFQKGVLWWAAHHRVHHRRSDQEGDLHSARRDGFWWSHMGWFLCRDLEDTDLTRVRDLARYPELRWLGTYWLVPPLVLAGLLLLVGGWFALVWGFAVSQVLTWHGTFTINSLSHMFGSRRYATDDDSRNNVVLALVTLGEGWHNNHHHYQVAARQGFHWWQLDLTYLVLRVLAGLGVVWDLHGVPAHVLEAPAPATPPGTAARPSAAVPTGPTLSGDVA
ncbi:MAG: acyl-CoA desaturase [Kofleriaceae bacterium]|nr:acyl-CoA desaturase [Kofleriaceae bacterium]